MRELSRFIVMVPLVVAAGLAAAGSRAAGSERLGTHREQSARHYCWKRIGLKPDDTPSTHQAERLRPCVKKRLGYDDPYMDQF
jgi:hypothetical protein